jgi:hypothetical protein
MDGRKNNGGHSTKAKRPNDKRLAPRYDYENMIEAMDSTLPPDSIWSKVSDHIESGDLKALELWIKYRFGAPKQSVDVTSNGDGILIPISSWAKE